MKWFKHISDSLDDPFIFGLIDTYGGDGYLVFFGVIEIYSREFKPELNWKLSITQAYLKQKLHKRQATLIIKILKHIKNSGKWEIEFSDNQVTIFIPKFKRLIDEWTSKKLRSKSGDTPTNLRLEVEVEVDKEADKETTYINSKNSIPYEEIINYLNQKAGTKYKHTSKETQKHIKARWNSGFGLIDFFTVMDKKEAWILDPKYSEYYRPQTLFGTKFESYLNAPEKNYRFSETTAQNIEVGKEWLTDRERKRNED